jgi:hypothetical protein
MGVWFSVDASPQPEVICMLAMLVREAFEAELKTAREAAAAGDERAAWSRLERAHILGQRSTRAHVRAHVQMLRLAWQRKDSREIFGQLTRIAGASLFSRIWIPEGNTGGSNVSAFRSMPVPKDLRRLLDTESR